MRRLRLAPEAADDLQQAQRWYEEQRDGLGDAFVRAVEATFLPVQRTPESFRFAWPPFHRAPVRRFPYEIYYYFDDDAVTIALVFHTAHRPSKVRSRLKAR